jgi:chaperonin GroEL
LGPKGRNVVIQRPSGSPWVTNDGATIAKEIELGDDAEDMGLRLIREAAVKTKDLAGDGSTTALVLAQVIIREGMKNISFGANPIELKKGIQGATQLATAAIRKVANPVETREAIAQVAAAAAKDPAIGEMIAEAIDRVGMDGVITVEETGSRDTTLIVKEGMQLGVGYLSPEMVTDRETMVAQLENPYILITDRKIDDPQELLPLLEQVAKQGRPLLILAEGVEGKALGMLVMNKMNGALNSVAIHPPAYGEGRRARMEDIAILTGGTYITDAMGYVLREATLDLLGSAASVRVEKKNTVILGGAGDKNALAARVRSLRMRIEKTQYDFDRKQLEERLAKLCSGVAVFQVGAASEIEIQEKKVRIEKGISAAKAAAAEGIVPGGGIAYLSIIPAIKAYVSTLSGDMKTGAAILLKALVQPARQIAENAGMDGSAVLAEVKRRPPGCGFNAQTGEYANMIEVGIVDPARMVRLALQSAASVSAVLLTVEVGITDSKK